MGGFDDLYNTSLVLGLGLGFSSSSSTSNAVVETNIVKINKYCNSEPSLTLSLSGGEEKREIYDEKTTTNLNLNNKGSVGVVGSGGGRVDQLSGGDNFYRQDSGASSFMSNSNVSVKREREIGSHELEVEIERVTSRFNNNHNHDHDQEDDDGRKKLRLTKVQSALLEENFKLHSTLNPKQKQELARELNLRPRQVEVWFQNRRARTKLKQTEVDCEYLKKCCESLKDENQRLQKELQELKALKLAQPLYMQLPAATLTMCPSCERIGATTGVGVGGTENAAKSNFTMTPKPHFYNPFTNQSAAC